ncbi:MAG: VWA domain-containing protein [Candidatus Nanohalobium sp.]
MIVPIQFHRPLLLLAALAAASGAYILWKASSRSGYIMGISRTLFFLLLAVALAGPFIQDVKTVQSTQNLFLLRDSSNSADPIHRTDPKLENVNIERRTLLRGNNSNLASALDSELRPDARYLLVSDGRSSEDLQNVLEKYRGENATISVLKPDIDKERAVYVSGPSSTVPGAATKFTVHVSSTRPDKVPVKVYLDNSTVLNSQISGSWSFNRSFDSRGTHRIRASIGGEDRYSGNNRYYKVVKVRKKPNVLYVGKKSDLTGKISDFYDLNIVKRIPDDLSDYYAVISTKALNSDRLSSYISRGNGYMYLGGYKTPARYLPVKASSENYDTESTRVVIAIETSSQAGTSIKDSKDLAYALVKELPLNTKLASLYYSQDAHVLSKLQTLAYNKDSVLRKISSVKPIAETRHGVGLQAAKQMADGKGNIVLFTDGNFFRGPESSVKQPAEVRRDAFKVAESLDVNFYVVGVGKDPNRQFLQELAHRGGGRYISADNVWRLGFKFGAGGGTSAFKPLAVVDTQHFITRDMGLDTSVPLFDEVKPKRSANVLVSGPGKREFLTTWNYGLGRVATFSGGQPTLSRVLRSDPGLVSRTASWTVGDPKRKKDKWIEISGNTAPGKPEVKASYPVEGLTYSSQDRYTGSISPEGLGFHSFSGRSFAYNYNPEIRKVGYRDDVLDRIASATGGRVYSPSELGDAGFNGTGSEQVSYTRPLGVYFLAAALVLFLLEIGYRKLNGKK